MSVNMNMAQAATKATPPFPTVAPARLGTVAVLMGGTSGEREISLLSGNGVLTALRSIGVNAVAFDPALQSISELVALNASRAVVCLHGKFGEDGCIQGVLETIKLPYTGSGVMASSIAMDKVMTKRLWLADGLPTPAYRWVRSEADLLAAQQALGDIAVKPAREGSSLGFSHVTNASEVPAAWAKASQLASDILAEEFIVGRELTVAVLQIDGVSRALPIVEIIAPKGNYDYQNKYFKDDTRYVCPALLPAELSQTIARLAQRAFDSVGCTTWGRVDVMLRGSDQAPYLLEVNTAPGMTSHSSLPMAARAVGLEYPALCSLIASLASLKL
jgi:D-alanine-D-alanine ligase